VCAPALREAARRGLLFERCFLRGVDFFFVDDDDDVAVVLAAVFFFLR
jgi:hypothetical protein